MVKEKNKMKNKKGITLIALVITILVLLILAGVAISTLGGDNGIISKAKTAKSESEYRKAEEEVKVVLNGYQTEKYKTSETIPLGDYLETAKSINQIDNYKDKSSEGKYIIERDGYEFEVDSESLEITSSSGNGTSGSSSSGNNFIEINFDGKNISVGETTTITTTEELVWSSSNTSCVTVELKNEENEVTITGISEGSAYVIGKHGDNEVIKCLITVKNATNGNLKKVSLGTVKATGATAHGYCGDFYVSFNASSIPNYQNLTANNFIGYCSMYRGVGDSNLGNFCSYMLGTEVTAYNSNTGIVTVKISCHSQKNAYTDEANVSCICYYIEE